MDVGETEITISGKGKRDAIVIKIEQTDRILLVYNQVRLHLVFIFKDEKELEVELTEFYFWRMFESRKSLVKSYQKFMEMIEPYPQWREKIDDLFENDLLRRLNS